MARQKIEGRSPLRTPSAGAPGNPRCREPTRARIAAVGHNDQVGNFAVQRIADRRTGFPARAWRSSTALQQRPVVRALGAHAPAARCWHADRRPDRATTGTGGCRDRGSRRRRWPARCRCCWVRRLDDLLLALAEAVLAFLLEDERNVDAGALLDLVVGVDKAQAAGLGQALDPPWSCRRPWGRPGKYWIAVPLRYRVRPSTGRSRSIPVRRKSPGRAAPSGAGDTTGLRSN